MSIDEMAKSLNDMGIGIWSISSNPLARFDEGSQDWCVEYTLHVAAIMAHKSRVFTSKESLLKHFKGNK